MPSKSKRQHNFMEAVAHSPQFAKKVGVPQSVGKEFSKADKGKTFQRGGEMKESKAMAKKEVSFMKKKGAPASMIKHETAEMEGMKKGGKVKKMAMGGTPLTTGTPMDPRKAAMIAQMMRGRRPGAPAAPAPVPGMKKGGAVYTRAADGVASRGKTKATQIKMAKGGMGKKYC